MLEDVTFVSEHVIKNTVPDDTWALISISEPGREVDVAEGWVGILRLQFHDIDDDVKPEHHGLTLFKKEQAHQILDFVAKHKDKATKFVVNCSAGVSRSAAVAKYLSEKLGVEMKGMHDGLFYNRFVYRILHTVEQERSKCNEES